MKTKVGDWLKGKEISYGTPEEFKIRKEGGEPPNVPDSGAAPRGASQDIPGGTGRPVGDREAKEILANRTQGTAEAGTGDMPDATETPPLRPSTDQPSTEAAIKTLVQDWDDQNNRDDQSYRKTEKRELPDKDSPPKLHGERMPKNSEGVVPSDRGKDDDH
ncbi:hypothetical protein A7A08_02374 [Methyloligella halotolerans]|uniref:Uncharacterized protein n=1 Tax=Methyloligella halotolerans TaxID=1177755 RepID=A0A1E2RWH2_9HYPH|nr:hypothetical protein [Methyloligella halotolerans]ODA66606.1 hypothetical protein A7A08_02374 [Methyloligella halotolerans]